MARDTTRLEDHFGTLLLLLVASFLVVGVSEAGWVKALGSSINVATIVVAFRATAMRIDLGGLAAVATAGILGIVGGVALPGDWGEGVRAASQVVVVAVLLLAVVARVLRHRTVTVQTLFGAIAAYVLLGQLFAWVYVLVQSIDDQPIFDGADGIGGAIYFSYVTLTTVGFGDVTPLTELVRRITIVEAMAGQIFLATLVARLVSLYGVHRGGSEPQSGPAPGAGPASG